MSSYSDYLEAALLNAVFRNTSYTSPATVYMALYTVTPSDAGGGTEVSTGGYARQSITFGAPSAGVILNSALVSFTASGANYGTVVAFGIFDASTSGNLLAWGPVTSAVVNDGDTISFAIGAISVTQT